MLRGLCCRAYVSVKQIPQGSVQMVKAPTPAIVKSPQDKRSYKRVSLANGLDVLLISDPEIQAAAQGGAGNSLVSMEGSESGGSSGVHSDAGSEDMESELGEKHIKKAAAALAVGTGSFSDPDSVQGLSHYLEHMLFMGSKAFPDENDYDSFLSNHGGSSNAYTENEYTNYHFDVKPEALHGALQRFSQFFIAPLCKADALTREVNAVDNEFTGVQQSDGTRLAQVRCHTSRPGHLYHKFTWGNRKSLVDDPAAAGVDVRQELVKYWEEQYSAERMTLAILGGEPLGVLEGWAKELFSAVPSGRGPRRSFASAGKPFKGGQLCLVLAVKQGHELVVTFTLPPLTPRYRAKAEDYLSHLIGHEGKGSLLSALKAQGLASGLWAGVGEEGYTRNSACFLFEVHITLTKAGLEAAPGAGLAAVKVLFEYVHLLREVGPQRWVYDEMAAISNLKFRFAEEEDACEYVTRLAADMPHFSPEHVLAGSFLYTDWDPTLVEELLACLVPSEVRLDLQTSDFQGPPSGEQHAPLNGGKGEASPHLAAALGSWAKLPGAVEGVEPWFDLPYLEVPLPTDLLKGWEHAKGSPVAEGLSLPERNTYVPTDFSLSPQPVSELKASGGPASEMGDGVQPLTAPPNLLLDREGLRVWHKLDSTFLLPKATTYFALASKEAYTSAEAAVCLTMTAKLAEEALCETAYLAEVTGLSYSVHSEGLAGLEVRVDGFSQKLPLLVESIFRHLADLKVEEAAFAREREALILRYQNALLKPERHAEHLRLRALKHLYKREVLLAALETLKPATLQAFISKLFREVHVEALLQGNLTAEASAALCSAALSTLRSRHLAAHDRPVDTVASLKQGTSLLHRVPVANPEEDCSVVEIYFQAEPDNTSLRARLDLLEQILSEPVFEQLRTKEQLGYSVHAGVRLTHSILGFVFSVVSGKHGPAHLDSRVEAFLERLDKTLEEMEEGEFEGHRLALIAAKLQKDPSLSHEADRNWDAVTSRRYNFQEREEEVEAVQELSKEEVQECLRTYLLPASQHRRKLALHVVGKGHSAELSAPLPAGVTGVTDVDSLRDIYGTFPPRTGQLPKPLES